MIKLSEILFYKWWYIRRPLKWLSPLISIFEKQKINKYGSQPSEYSPVFIIGVPRSGTTILYQLVTQFLNVAYFNNFVNLSRENLYFGYWLSQKIFKGEFHNSYVSDYGNTKESGLTAPSEIGNFWYRWISQNKIYINENDLTIDEKQEIYNNFTSIINKYNQPLVIKNLYLSQRLRLIYDIFPNAKFIYIKRDPLFTAQSLFLGRRKHNRDISEWWSIKPKNFQEIKNLSALEQVVAQTYYLDKQIHEDLSLFPAENIMNIQYENIGDVNIILERIKQFLGIQTREKLRESKPEISIQNTQKLQDQEFWKLEQIVANYNWDIYLKN